MAWVLVVVASISIASTQHHTKQGLWMQMKTGLVARWLVAAEGYGVEGFGFLSCHLKLSSSYISSKSHGVETHEQCVGRVGVGACPLCWSQIWRLTRMSDLLAAWFL
jgi:hypothetical protein